MQIVLKEMFKKTEVASFWVPDERAIPQIGDFVVFGGVEYYIRERKFVFGETLVSQSPPPLQAIELGYLS